MPQGKEALERFFIFMMAAKVRKKIIEKESVWLKKALSDTEKQIRKNSIEGFKMEWKQGHDLRRL